MRFGEVSLGIGVPLGEGWLSSISLSGVPLRCQFVVTRGASMGECILKCVPGALSKRP